MERKYYKEVRELLEKELQKQEVILCKLLPVKVSRDCGHFVVVNYPNGDSEAVANSEFVSLYKEEKGEFVGKNSHKFLEWKGDSFVYDDMIFVPGTMICVDSVSTFVVISAEKFSRKYYR